MDADLLFTICSRAILPACALLAVAPRWKWTRVLIFSALVPSLLAASYIYAFTMAYPFSEGANFDLFVGAWEVRDAERLEIAHLWVLPCLFFTLMLGPVGLLLYFCLRFALVRRMSTMEATQ